MRGINVHSSIFFNRDEIIYQDEKIKELVHTLDIVFLMKIQQTFIIGKYMR